MAQGFDIYNRARLSFIANTITADNPVKPRSQGISVHGMELFAPIIPISMHICVITVTS